MKKIILFFVSIILGFGLVLFYFRSVIYPVNTKSAVSWQQPKENSQFSLEKAPQDSLVGNILSVSGVVNWQSRVATEPSQLVSPVPLQQGEKIVTDKGSLSLELGSGLISLSSQTELSFVQTLSTNIVLEQDQGTVNYTKISDMPLGVRSLSLLSQIATGSATISVDKKLQTVTIEVNQGEVTVAYNDADFVSQVKTISKGNKFIFDDETKKGKISSL